MKHAHLLILIAVLGVAGLTCATSSQDAAGSSAGIRVGIFDSRAVAIAFARSEFNESAMTKLREQLEEAKEAGDEERAAEIEAQGVAHQDEFHRMGFSTASVAGLLEHIEDEIPGIAKAAGVDLIVSKWDLVYQAPDAQLVDVTELLVQPYDPDERVMGWIRDLKDRAPVSEDELQHDH